MQVTNPLPNCLKAHGEPLFCAVLRSQTSDFQVLENLGWELSGDGEHDFLFVEKEGNNTEWVAQRLAQFAGVPEKDIGFAGMKDRHAITRQWFSVPRWNKPDWGVFAEEGVRILEVGRHLRKLKRGAHDTNSFKIVLRHAEPIDELAVTERIERIRTLGVPNYYGEQRFGRGGSNIGLADAWAKGKRLSRNKRSIAISTVRSYLFNETLSTRVETGTWNQLVAGDKANLDGSGSVFSVPEIDAALADRCMQMDVHPAVDLAGEGSNVEPAHWQAALDKARVAPDQRALRLRAQNLEYVFEEGALTLSFTLGRGAFATSVLRELCHWN